MRSLFAFGRRRFTVGGLVVAAWGVVRELVNARPAGAQGGVQMQKQGGMQMQKSGATQKSVPGASAPFRAKVKSFDVSGGSKPGDTVTLKLTIETTGGGTKNVPWVISRDNDVVIKADTKPNVAGGTTFDVSTTWTATTGAHDFYGEVDPQNTLGEPSSQRGNNISARTTRVFSDWPRWLAAAKTGAKTAVSRWQAQAMLVGITINGPVATGGRVHGPDIGGAIHDALTGAGMPGSLASQFGHAVNDTWRAWTDTIRVPGLPWYPAFAAFPGPQAPPMPNVPTPLAGLAQDPGKLAPGALASRIRANIGAAKDWPGAGGIDGYANWFSASILAWIPICQITNVMGKGRIPSFAPPYVPVGPVVAGDNIAAPGHFTANAVPWLP